MHLAYTQYLQGQKNKSLCDSGGKESVTYFSYRFKYVTDAVYVLQI